MERVTVAEAAKRLEVTQEAVRARVRRGTIEHEKGEDGRLYVYITPDQPDERSVTNPVVNDYINALKSQVESLERDRDEWREEARRKDAIIMSLTQRIPALEEPSSDPRDAPVSAAEERGSAGEPGADGGPQKRSSWWRRFFGME